MPIRFPELEEALTTSELLAAVARDRGRTPRGSEPSMEMVAQLKANRCWAEDWAKIRVPDGFNPLHCFDAKFMGEVELGLFRNHDLELGDGVTMSSGVYSSVVKDCVIGDDALVYNVGMLANSSVGPRAVVASTRFVSCRGRTTYGNGRNLMVGIEIGGRQVHVFAEIDVALADAIARHRADTELQGRFVKFALSYAEAAAHNRTLIEEGARVVNAGRVVDAYIGPWAIVDNALKVEESTILSGRDEPTRILDGTYVNQSIVQWGARVASGGQVDRSVICEHAGADRAGRVLHSVIGPNTHIAGGEVTASVVGPFVGFHHQALLIAALWPEGRGYVGYGANVGSNHTSKAPDQEIRPGEGLFFGMGVTIKYPADYSRAPFSILATSVNALPQRVEFPFSLINKPAIRPDGMSPAYNEIMPGWVLGHQLYGVLREERRHRESDRSRRGAGAGAFDTFRPSVIDLMVEARRRLLSIREVKAVYSEDDVAGLGKNFLLEAERLAGIESYAFHVRLYALRGFASLVEKFLADGAPFDVNSLASGESDDPRREHARQILVREIPTVAAEGLLRELVRHEERVARDVQMSKEKDDNRGARVIDGYADAHVPAASDPFVRLTWRDAEARARETKALMLRLGIQPLVTKD